MSEGWMEVIKTFGVVSLWCGKLWGSCDGDPGAHRWMCLRLLSVNP